MRISIIAHPNAKRFTSPPASPRGEQGGPRIEEDLLGTLHVYVNAPPLEGKANRAVIEALAEYFNVKKSCVLLIAGAKSKTKTFRLLKD